MVEAVDIIRWVYERFGRGVLRPRPSM